MKTLRWPNLFILLIALVLASCQQGSDSSKDKVYDIKGKVVAVDVDKKKVTLDHEDIPGLMKAMEMPFTVENAKVLEGIQAGDQVQGRLKVTYGSYIITELHKR